MDALRRFKFQGHMISYSFFTVMVGRPPTEGECLGFEIDGVETPPMMVMDHVPFRGSSKFSPDFPPFDGDWEDLPLLEGEEAPPQQGLKRGRPMRQTRHSFGGRSYQNKRGKRN